MVGQQAPASFNAEEVEELRRIDAELDATPLNAEDYRAQALVDEILSHTEMTDEKRKWFADYYQRNRERKLAYAKAYHESHREEEAARKRAWYLANKARIAAQQKEYRERVGRCRTDEERKADKEATMERKRRKSRERYWQKKGMTPEEADAQKIATEAQLTEEERLKRAYSRTYRQKKKE